MACIRVMEELSSEISAMTFYEGWNLLVTGGRGGRTTGVGRGVAVHEQRSGLVTSMTDVGMGQ